MVANDGDTITAHEWVIVHDAQEWSMMVANHVLLDTG